MQKEISNFITANKVASIACCDDTCKPYSFHCFYVFDEVNHLLFFKSSSSTYHAKLLEQNSYVAGSILPEKIDLISLKGIQFTGQVISENFPDNIDPSRYYHKKLPFALAKPGQVWCIELATVKMTDNTNIFGKKLKWFKDMVF